jgi:glutathione peroxidase
MKFSYVRLLVLFSVFTTPCARAELPGEVAPYAGKVMLIVNTASQCGYTGQYEGLETIYQRYKNQKFVVLAFPSNDFGGQEPGSDKQIRFFCESKYHVTFPIFKKAKVTGKNTQAVFQWALKEAPTHSEIAWNFEKFLVYKDGKVIQRFKSEVDPNSKEITNAIERALHD